MVGWNTHYKYHSKYTHFLWQIKWQLELLGALRIMGDGAYLHSLLTFHRSNTEACPVCDRSSVHPAEFSHLVRRMEHNLVSEGRQQEERERHYKNSLI